MPSPCPTAECWSVSHPDGSIGIVCTSIKCREERPPETQSADWPLLATMLLAIAFLAWMRGGR